MVKLPRGGRHHGESSKTRDLAISKKKRLSEKTIELYKKLKSKKDDVVEIFVERMG